MKLLVVGDQHFRYELPYASAIPDGRRSEWEAVKQTILETAKRVDAVVLCGDNLNSRHNHSSVIHEFVEFLKGFGNKPLHIITGNHERFSTHTALDFLQKIGMPNWHIYTDIATDVQLADGVNATFIPYVTPAMLGAVTKEEAQEKLFAKLKKGDVAFAHHAVTGAKSTEFFNEIMLDQDKMGSLFKMTFFGHLHKAERLRSNVQGTGNIFTHEVGEPSKSIWILDGDAVEEIKLPVRGIYKVDWSEDVEKTFGGIPANSIVKCIVTVRGTDIELVKEALKRFDAGIVVEQYANERAKVHFEGGGMDLSVESLLGMYSQAKGLKHEDVMAGFNLIQ